MEKQSALPAWLLYLVIALAIACAVGAALLFTQLDSYQQRSLLPQATLPAVDQEATLSASDVTVVVIAPEQTAAAEPSSTPLPAATRSEPTAVVPSETPTSETVCLETPDDWVAYTVQDQDTLASLALELGTTIVLLRQANCIEDIPIQPGQVIFVPALSGTADAGEICLAPEGWLPYVVQEGDSIVMLASRHGISLPELITGNCLSNVDIVPGQILFIPPEKRKQEMWPEPHWPPLKKTPSWGGPAPGHRPVWP